MPPNWNDGHQQEVELAERIRDPRVALEPVERRGVQIEDRVAVARDLRGVGLAVEHPERAAVPLGGLDLEPARGEREEIGRDRLRLREAERPRRSPCSPRPISAPLASASQPSGTSSASDQRALRSG